jgi:purine-cytosine permease-like protein
MTLSAGHSKLAPFIQPEDPMPDADQPNSFAEFFRVRSAFIIVITGLAIFALLAYFLPVNESWKASEVNSLVGTLTTFLGTAVGAFLGVQIGAAGKERSDQLAKEALGQLSPDKAAEVLHKVQ